MWVPIPFVLLNQRENMGLKSDAHFWQQNWKRSQHFGLDSIFVSPAVTVAATKILHFFQNCTSDQFRIKLEFTLKQI